MEFDDIAWTKNLPRDNQMEKKMVGKAFEWLKAWKKNSIILLFKQSQKINRIPITKSKNYVLRGKEKTNFFCSVIIGKISWHTPIWKKMIHKFLKSSEKYLWRFLSHSIEMKHKKSFLSVRHRSIEVYGKEK